MAASVARQLPVTDLEDIVASSQKLSPETRRLYLGRVRAFVAFAGKRMSDWTPMAVEKWRNHLLKEGIDPRSVNVYLQAVRYASRRYSDLNQEPRKDFARAAESVRVLTEKHPKKYALTRAQCQKLLATCKRGHPPDIRDRAMILVGVHTAHRRKAICNLELRDVNINTGEVVAVTKGNRRHVVKVTGEALEALREWVAWLGARKVISGRLFRRLRPTTDGTYKVEPALSPSGFYSLLKVRGEAAGLPGIHPHALRHTHVWLALEAGVPAWRVQLVLGHQSKMMTMYYAEDLSADGVGAGFPNLGGKR